VTIWLESFTKNVESDHGLSEEDYWRRSLGKQSHLNLFTAWGAIAATAAFIVFYVTLRETMIQVSLNRQQFEAGTGASVGVEELHIVGILAPPSHLSALPVLGWIPTFRLKNFGKSTATDVNVWASTTSDVGNLPTEVLRERFREIAHSVCEVAFEFKKSASKSESFPIRKFLGAGIGSTRWTYHHHLHCEGLFVLALC
jgi:hypothetical protein